jgi:hypothetical protein
VPIPPPLVPDEEALGHRGQADEFPPPPQRTSSSTAPQSSRAKGKRSRHAGTGESRSSRQKEEADSHGDIHYPKYEMYNSGQYTKYSSGSSQPRECQYTTKYGEDCYFSTSKYADQSSAQGHKTWPTQHIHDDAERPYTQDDQRVKYLEQLEAETSRLLLRGEDVREPRYASSAKKRTKQQQQHHHSARDKSPCDYPSSSHYRDREREYLVTSFVDVCFRRKVSDQMFILELSPKISSKSTSTHLSDNKGCQIFPCTTYQYGKNIPKWPQNIPTGHNII